MHGGGCWFVLNRRTRADVGRAIRRGAAGENVVEPELAARSLRSGASRFSEREREILSACGEGLTTAQLAERS